MENNEPEHLHNVAADLQRAAERDAASSVTNKSATEENERRVLVIYTGGTIGMIDDPGRGYIPVRNLLYDNLKEQARFNDPHGESVLNASSLEDYQKWQFRASSRSNLPTLAQQEQKQHESKPQPHLQPHQAQQSLDVNMSPRSDWSERSVDENIKPAESSLFKGAFLPVKKPDQNYKFIPSLVTPRFHSGRSVRYAILEYDTLIDSSEVNMQDWIRIATDIELNYALYDAFIVLHGTDTLSYTASALSFLLEDLGKTVIITGAQVPISYLRNDAVGNLLDSLTLAGNCAIPEVGVCFSNHLFRGNRCIKSSSFEFDAFTSPNLPPLVKMGIDIDVRWRELLHYDPSKTFKAHKEMSTNVAIIRMFPGITTQSVRNFLSEPMEGVVLETFGAGNIPQRQDLLDVLKEASDRGVVIVNVTQCIKGSVVDLYESGKKLRNLGIVCGYDMTSECALTKLSYLLSKTHLSRSQIRSLMSKSLRGELIESGPALAGGSILNS